jgi:type I restriction enzyme S subunit
MNKYPIKKLSEIIVLNYWKAVDKSDKSDEGLYDVYGANGVMYKSKKFNFEWESIIIWRKWSAWAINRVRGKLWASDVTYYVTTDQNVDYICYTLKKLNLPELAKWVKPWINRNDVYEIQIPLPPLSTQSRIVARLDAAFASIDEQITLIRSNIADVENTRKSALRKVFRDSIFEMKRIDSLALIMSAWGTPSRNESEFWWWNIPWYSSWELNDLYTKDSREFITKKWLESSSAKLFPRWTLLIWMYDTAAMKMSVLDREWSCNQAVVGFFQKKK